MRSPWAHLAVGDEKGYDQSPKRRNKRSLQTHNGRKFAATPLECAPLRGILRRAYREPQDDNSTSTHDSVRLNRMALEEVNQLDDQNDDHHQFEHEGSRLIELFDHEAVEVFGGVKFFLYQIFVIRHANFLRAQLVQPRGKHVAQELDGVIGALGEFVHIEQHGMQFRGCASGAPASPGPGASLLEEVVDVFQLTRHELVIMTKLEQLRVRVLQQLDRS